MPFVTYIEKNGTQHRVQSEDGRSLMQIAVTNGVPGIVAECGGSCSCGTCHAYINEPWAAKLPPISEGEAMMLEAVLEPRETSRLCCQIPMRDDLDGIVVQLPAEQI